eukprot:gene29029-32231_t
MQYAQRLVRPCSRAAMMPAFSRRAMSVSASAVAKSGDTVEVQYTGTLDDGTVFDTSRQEGRTPLKFTVGSGQVIKGFDIAVSGLAVGENKKHRMEAVDAYGEMDPKAIMDFPRQAGMEEIKAGVKVQLSNGAIATVQAVNEEAITLNLNHELAGKALTFDVELVSLNP